MARTAYRARWVIPVSTPPIADGRLVVEEGKLVAVERAGDALHDEIDLGDVAVLPGFVNAHTHLELTSCRGCVPFRGSFVQWLEDLVSRRRLENAEALLGTSIRQGLNDSMTAGVTLVGDIGTGSDAVQAWQTSPISVVGFLEVTGMGARRFVPHLQSFDLLRPVCECLPATGYCPVGISPHAPYSTAPELYQAVIAFVRATGRPICTHLAESKEEIRFLADGQGPLRDLLERWNLWDESFEPPGCSPVEYAERLGLLTCQPVLAHVNYATDRDLDILAAHDCHVVYCPRSHAFFGHEPHPYPRMLARGISICIGTDSLASNESLSVLDELRFLHARDPHLDPQALLAMGTLAGARALGCESVRGSLQPGKCADWVAIPLSDPGTRRPAEDVLGSHEAPSVVCIGGRCTFVDG